MVTIGAIASQGLNSCCLGSRPIFADSLGWELPAIDGSGAPWRLRVG
jgi:hypothetical protein